MADVTPPGSRKRKAEDTPRSTNKVLRNAADAPSYGRRTVAVTVQGERFNVHEDLLKRHSEFFKAALDGRWTESKERMVSLKEFDDAVNVQTFEIFYHFLYTGHIFSNTNDSRDDQEGQSTEWNRLASVWYLGEQMLSTSLKDASVDAMISKVIALSLYPMNAQDDVYSRSSRSSGLRRLLVDFAVWAWKSDCLGHRGFRESEAEFYFEIAVALSKTRSAGRQGTAPFRSEDTCIYHEHEAEGKVCYKTMF